MPGCQCPQHAFQILSLYEARAVAYSTYLVGARVRARAPPRADAARAALAALPLQHACASFAPAFRQCARVGAATGARCGVL